MLFIAFWSYSHAVTFFLHQKYIKLVHFTRNMQRTKEYSIECSQRMDMSIYKFRCMHNTSGLNEKLIKELTIPATCHTNWKEIQKSALKKIRLQSSKNGSGNNCVTDLPIMLKVNKNSNTTKQTINRRPVVSLYTMEYTTKRMYSRILNKR